VWATGHLVGRATVGAQDANRICAPLCSRSPLITHYSLLADARRPLLLIALARCSLCRPLLPCVLGLGCALPVCAYSSLLSLLATLSRLARYSLSL
jgi:hypothetical protein